jgi:hypothetical protein
VGTDIEPAGLSLLPITGEHAAKVGRNYNAAQGTVRSDAGGSGRKIAPGATAREALQRWHDPHLLNKELSGS